MLKKLYGQTESDFRGCCLTNVEHPIKNWWLYLMNFYRNYLENLKYNVKEACIFHLILVGIPSSSILSIKKRGGGEVGGFYLKLASTIF